MIMDYSLLVGVHFHDDYSAVKMGLPPFVVHSGMKRKDILHGDAATGVERKDILHRDARRMLRRGYAAAASNGALSSVVRGGGRSGMVKKGEEKASESSSWIPDPVTGYYRPENRAAEIDVVDLREMLLTRKITHN
ncbi:hypothetical protein HHK36_026540 [Tetracentron sinense]|uniref:Uncharacterized protein n=1 Tax=Tetracentron sinense TaxID=13715 RepID=A0A834YJN6_TETSI|nr:hypothetical protein HHK36_026540 [Tetracentron sinense]